MYIYTQAGMNKYMHIYLERPVCTQTHTYIFTIPLYTTQKRRKSVYKLALLIKKSVCVYKHTHTYMYITI